MKVNAPLETFIFLINEAVVGYIIAAIRAMQAIALAKRDLII